MCNYLRSVSGPPNILNLWKLEAEIKVGVINSPPPFSEAEKDEGNNRKIIAK